MKSSLRVVAVVSLLLALACGAYGVWSYYGARSLGDESIRLRNRAFGSYDRSDEVKGTPEEALLVDEGQRYEREADAALDAAKSRRRLALALGVGSLVLIILSLVLMAAHLRRKEAARA